MSSTLIAALLNVELILVGLILLAALVFLIVKRRPFAAAGAGAIAFTYFTSAAWYFAVPSFVDNNSMDTYLAVNFAFQTVSNVIFLVGLGLILAEIFVKRPAGGSQGQP